MRDELPSSTRYSTSGIVRYRTSRRPLLRYFLFMNRDPAAISAMDPRDMAETSVGICAGRAHETMSMSGTAIFSVLNEPRITHWLSLTVFNLAPIIESASGLRLKENPVRSATLKAAMIRAEKTPYDTIST